MIVTGATAVEAVRDLQPHRFALWYVTSDGDPADVRLVARAERDCNGRSRIAEVYTNGKHWHAWVRDGDDALGFLGPINPTFEEAMWAARRYLIAGPEKMGVNGLQIVEVPTGRRRGVSRAGKRTEVIPLSSNDRPRHEYDGIVLTGAWSGAKLYWREMSRAVTASPAHWDSDHDIFDWVIEVERIVPDSEGVEGQLPITITLPCPMDPSTPAALPYWRALMYRAAMHEVDEALRTSDGVCPHNPHLFNGSQDIPVSFIERIAPAQESWRL